MGRKKLSLEECKKLFEMKKEEIQAKLTPGEEMAHCIDQESFNGQFYYPLWVVTSKARIYSLWTGKWRKINKRNKSGWGKYSCGNMYVHLIVANYFCDKTIVEKYGEENVDVHHNNGYDPDKSNEENNSADCISYAPNVPNLHGDMTKIQRGTYKEEAGSDTLLSFAMSNFPHAYKEKRASISVSVNEEGNDKLDMKIGWNGSITSKEDFNEIFRKYPGTDEKKILASCPELRRWSV